MNLNQASQHLHTLYEQSISEASSKGKPFSAKLGRNTDGEWCVEMSNVIPFYGHGIQTKGVGEGK
jgi:hypothetical protein